MYHEFFSGKGIVQLPIVAMFIFMVVFAGIVLSALRRKDPDHDGEARLPLDEESYGAQRGAAPSLDSAQRSGAPFIDGAQRGAAPSLDNSRRVIHE